MTASRWKVFAILVCQLLTTQASPFDLHGENVGRDLSALDSRGSPVPRSSWQSGLSILDKRLSDSSTGIPTCSTSNGTCSDGRLVRNIKKWTGWMCRVTDLRCASSCCSKDGACGFGPDFCGDGCQSNCDAKAECGEYSKTGNETCGLDICCGSGRFVSDILGIRG